MTKLTRRLLLAAGVLAGLGVIVVAALYAFLKFSVLPLHDGHRLAGNAVTTVVTDHFGPVAIGAYLITLNNGGFALIDAGSDPKATRIREVLAHAGKGADDVRAIFLTHAHADHAGGVAAFPDAAVYVFESDAAALARSRPLQDGAAVDVSGTRIETFAVPGHTPGSAAILAHGVLFVGDTAAAAYDGSFQPNTMMGANPEQVPASLRALADRLRPRRAEIRAIAFGHQGPLTGLDPLLNWARAAE